MPTSAPLVGVALKGAVSPALRRRDERPAVHRRTRRDHAVTPSRPCAAVSSRSCALAPATLSVRWCSPIRTRSGSPSPTRRLLAAIASQAGIVLDIARLFRAAEFEIEARRRAEAVQRFYAETSTMLSWSLDFPESYERFASLCVPFLADLCLIDVAEEHAIRRVAAVHADPDQGRRSSRSSSSTTNPTPSATTRRRVWCAAAAPSSARTCPTSSCARPRRSRGALPRRQGARLHLVHVRPARPRAAGSSARSRSCRRARDDDSVRPTSPSPKSVARRAGLAIDNARLFFERDHVARARCNPVCCRRRCRRFPACASRRATARPARETRSAETSTTCSKCAGTRGGS